MLRGYETLVLSGHPAELLPWKQEGLLIDYGLGSSEGTGCVCVCVCVISVVNFYGFKWVAAKIVEILQMDNIRIQ